MPRRGGSGHRRARATIVGVAVATVLAGELGARAVEDHLPEPLDWHTAEAQRQVEQMDALADRGGADIVFVGSSVVHRGVDPAIVSTATGGTTVYNAALSAASPMLMEPWTLEAVLPRLDPELLVVGVLSNDLAAAIPGPPSFFEAFAASPAGRRAMGTDDVLDHVDRWLRDRSSLWSRRTSLRQPSLLLDALRGDDAPVDPDAAALEPNGRSSRGEEQRFEERNPDLYLPAEGWRLGTRGVAALRRLVTGARAVGTRVVLVDMPVTDEYVARHPNGEDDYATYLAALRALASDLDVPLIELDHLRAHELFADEVHLSRHGTNQFTPVLVDELEQVGAFAAPDGG